MKKRFMATVAMLSVLALVGCSTGAKTETTKAAETKVEEKATEAAASEDKKDGVMIGLSMNTQTNPFFVSVQQGVKDAAAKYGIEIVATDAQDDPAIQAKDIENLSSMKPAAIIVDTCDSDAIVPAIESCNEAEFLYSPWTERPTAERWFLTSATMQSNPAPWLRII